MATIESFHPPLERRVRNAIQSLGYSQLSRVECLAVGSTVRLRGDVSSFYLKQVAQSIAVKIPGVRDVKNEIIVQ